MIRTARRRALRDAGAGRAIRTGDRRERGAVLAELLIFLPLVLFAALAAVEIGGAYRARLTVSGSLRTTTRVLANAGRDGSADWQAVSVLRASLAGIAPANINRVVIYRAGADGDPLDPACVGTGVVASRGVSGMCNVYDATTLATTTAADFTASGAASCSGKFDAQWCPLDRRADLDAIGVWVSIRHDYATRFLPSSVTLDDRLVMRIEPEVG